jgi:hypothetical protein
VGIAPTGPCGGEPRGAKAPDGLVLEDDVSDIDAVVSSGVEAHARGWWGERTGQRSSSRASSLGSRDSAPEVGRCPMQRGQYCLGVLFSSEQYRLPSGERAYGGGSTKDTKNDDRRLSFSGTDIRSAGRGDAAVRVHPRPGGPFGRVPRRLSRCVARRAKRSIAWRRGIVKRVCL